jgi:hypothetical protein
MNIKNCNDAIFGAVLKEASLLYEQRQSKSIPPNAELRGLYPPSERQKTRMRKLFAMDRQRDFFKASFAFAKKAAAVFIVASVILSGTLMTSPKVRAAVAETIVEWYTEFIHIVSPNENSPLFNPLAWELDAPQGFVVVADSITPNNRIVVCESENGGDFVLTISPLNSDVYMDNELAQYKSIEDGGLVYYVFLSESGTLVDNRAYWRNSRASFLISTNLPEESIMQIVRSVRENK